MPFHLPAIVTTTLILAGMAALIGMWVSVLSQGMPI